jgi:RNA polymerase sigma factor (sigma-70 family)
MAHAALGSLLRYLRRFHDLSACEASDSELLRRYLGGDEAAFTALLRRHAPLVWGVCRRLLDNEQDAEDAFQAAFLVLLRKADSLRVPQSLAAFLHGVAFRIARKAKTMAQRRRLHEARAKTPEPSDPFTAVDRRDLRALLDEELDRLPEKYRVPLILCYLEGQSYAETARQLGWRDGTVCGRLARARELLRKRLSRRGLTLSGAMLVAAWTEPSSAPAATVAAVARMAALFALGQAAGNGAVSAPVATLAQGALQAMSMAKLKTVVALVLILGAFAAGASGTIRWTLAEKPSEPIPTAQAPKAETVRTERKDYYGDPLPPGTLARMGSVQLRHEEARLAFSADGEILISVGGDAMVRFWDMATGRQVRQTRVRPPEPPLRRRGSEIAGLSRDGKVVAAFDEKSLDLYDTMTGERLRQLPAEGVGHTLLAFSANGNLLATVVDIADNDVLRLWDLSTGKERLRLDKLSQAVNSLILSPDGRRLAYMDGGTLHVLDTATGRELGKGAVEGRCFAFSPDGQMLATAMKDENKATVTLWETAALKKRATLRPSRVTSRVIERLCLTFSPDGKLLVMGGLEALALWDVSTGKERLWLNDRDTKKLLFSPDGKILACAGSFEIRLWDIGTGERLHARSGHDSFVRSAAISPDGRVVASVGDSDPIVRFWEAATGKPLPLSVQHDTWVHACAFTSDGRMLISGGYGVTRLLDAATGTEQRRFIVTNRKTGEQDQAILVAHLSVNGKRLAVISTDETQFQLTLWDVHTGKRLVQRPLNGRFNSCFTPDGASVTVDGREQLTIEDTRTGQYLGAIRGDLGEPIAFSSDGQLAAVGMRETEPGPDAGWERLGVRMIEMASREELFHVDGWVEFTALSPDGRRLVTADPEALRLWDATTGELMLRRSWPANAVRRPLRSPINSLAFLPNGRALVTGMNDGTLLVWDMTPPMRKPENHKDLTGRELEVLWSDLAGDARKAQRAMHTLTASRVPALSLLAEHLRPSASVDAKRVDKLLADLDSEQFAVREAASRELTGMGEQIEAALQRVLENKPSLEMRNRVRATQESLRGVPPAATLRTLRAIRVLEAIDTEQARQLLRQLARGAAGARETREAKAALQRLTLRPSPGR